MAVKQVSIFVENKPGRMYEMTKVLADNNIDMRALSLSETEGFGIVRIIVDDVYDTATILKDAGYINKINHVVVVSIPDEPGGLSKVLGILNDEGINIDYMYAILGGKAANEALMVFRVDDYKKAEIELRKKGVKILTQEDINAI